MSDVNPEQFAEFATQDGPGSADVDGVDATAGAEAAADAADRTRTGQEHPAHEAHGGSMAPGVVDDTGHPETND